LDRQHSSSSDSQLALCRVPTSSDASEVELDAPRTISAEAEDNLQPFKYQQVSCQLFD